MEIVKPFTEINDALLSLDNGGRFYNLFTKADNGIISQSELGKLGGVFNDRQKMILFLELSLSKLKQIEKDIIVAKLDKNLKEAYLKFKPLHLLPSEVNQMGVLSSSLILTGIPKLIDSKSDFNGFILIPMLVGNTTTMSLIPLIDKYDVYEIREEQSSETFIIAHSKKSEKLPNKKITIAGVLKELKTNKDPKQSNKKFLEGIYILLTI